MLRVRLISKTSSEDAGQVNRTVYMVFTPADDAALQGCR